MARLTQAFRHLLPGLRYEAVNRNWEMTDFEHRPHGWPQAHRFVVARRFIPQEEAETTLFTLGRYVYRAWVTNMAIARAALHAAAFFWAILVMSDGRFGKTGA